MSNLRKNYRSISVFSPIFLSMISFVIALFSWFILPEFYTSYMHERSLYAFKLQPLIWVILCTAFFIVGAIFVRKIRVKRVEYESDYSSSNLLAIFCLSVVLIGVSILYLMKLITALGGFGSFSSSLFSFGSDVNRIKTYFVLQNVGLGWVPQMVFPFLVYMLYLISSNLKDWRIISSGSVLGLLYVLMILPSQTKSSVISLFLAMIFSFAFSRFTRGSLKLSKSLSYMLIILIAGLCVFLFFKSNQTESRELTRNSNVEDLIGYGPASFNRLAAILDNQLYIPNSNSAYYTNTWYWGIPGIIDNTQSMTSLLIFDMPQPAYQNWLATFTAVKASGLNDKYIWPTIYGEAYLDYGYFSLIWFALYGVLAELSWRAVLRRGSKYIIIYSVFLVSGLQWYATASIGNKSLIFATFLTFFIQFLSYIIRQKTNTRSSILSNDSI